MKSSKMFALVLLLCLVATGVLALPPLGKLTAPSATETTRLDYEAFVNSNNIFAFVTNHGMMFRDLSGTFGHDYGFFYPYTTTADIENGTNTKSVMYAAGIWMFGKSDGVLRGAVAEYNSEYYPGPMLGTSYDPDGHYNPDYRVYKLYADSMESNPNYDYIHWPVDQGAPLDANGKPLLLGKQTLYAAYNESSTESVWDNDAGTLPPLGIEVHQTVWGYGKSSDDTLFFPNYYPVTALDAGSEVIEAVVANPHAITGHDYLIEVVPITADSAYWRLIDRTIGATVLDHQYNFTGDASSPVVDGLRIQVRALGIRLSSFQATANAAGPIDPPVPAAMAGVGFPTPGGENPPSTQQTSGQRWLIHTADNGGTSGGGTRSSYEAFLSRTTRDGTNWPNILKGDYEFRFTGAGNYGIREADFGYAQDSLIPVPFEVWDIGKDTPDDPSDDVRVIPVLLENDDDGTFNLSAYGAGNEHSVSGADNDPFTDWVYLYRPSNPQPGQQQYDAAVALVQGGGNYDKFADDEILARIVFVAWNGGEAPPFVADMPETGTVFQILASEGFAAVDSFAFTATVPTFQTAGGDGNALYVKYDLFNNGGRDIQDMYISIWGDPDLGTSSDDLTACDTINHVYYTYNGDYSDAVYGVRCPAVGFTVLQGPIVPSPGDIAVSFGRAIPDYRNMDVTAFVRYYNGVDPNSSAETYNYMRGLNSDGTPLPNGSKFMVPGDPITMTGDLDVNPADRRMMGSIGPISMAPGDSQQVIVKWAVGQGEDRLQSIANLKDLLKTQSGLSVSLDTVSFLYHQSAPPPTGSITIESGLESYAYTVSGDQDWLLVEPTSGQTPATLSVTVDTTGLALGTYVGHLQITAPEAINSPRSVVVILTVEGKLAECGDVNDDTGVDSTDVDLIAAYLANTPPPVFFTNAADVDNIEGITFNDVLTLRRYLEQGIGSLDCSPDIDSFPRDPLATLKAGLTDITESTNSVMIPLDFIEYYDGLFAGSISLAYSFHQTPVVLDSVVPGAMLRSLDSVEWTIRIDTVRQRATITFVTLADHLSGGMWSSDNLVQLWFTLAPHQESGRISLDTVTSDGGMTTLFARTQGTVVPKLIGFGSMAFDLKPPTIYSVPLKALDIQSAYLDSDQLPDILLYSEEPSYVAWQRNRGNGEFDPAIIIDSTPKNGPWTMPGTGDFDCDGDQDIVRLNNEDRLVILWNSGTAHFESEQVVESLQVPLIIDVRRALVTSDLDNDGYSEILIGGRTAVEAERQPDESLEWHVFAISDLDYGVPVPGDFDGDGDLDVMAYNYEFHFLRNDGTFPLTHALAIISDDSSPQAFFAVDLEGDNDLDLVVIGSQYKQVFRNDGHANFQLIGRENFGLMFVGDMCAGDFDLDGNADRAATWSNALRIELGNGQGNFNNVLDEPAVSAVALVVLDANADGRPDFAESDYSNRRVGVSLNATLPDKPYLGVAPLQFSFMAKQGKDLPPTQHLIVRKWGPWNLGSPAVEVDDTWLEVIQVGNETDSTITFAVTPASTMLSPGKYRTYCRIRAAGAVNDSLTIPVAYIVRENPFLCCVGTTGNVDGQNTVTLSDLSLLIAYLTSTPRPELPCLAEANIDTHGLVDLSDLSYLIAYLTVTPALTLPDCPVGTAPLPNVSDK